MTGEEYIELIQYALKAVGGNETTAGRRGQKAMGVHALADELGRTFIVNAMSRGITPNVVMKWTGHSDYKAMKPYIDIVDSIRAREMSKMDFMD